MPAPAFRGLGDYMSEWFRAFHLRLASRRWCEDSCEVLESSSGQCPAESSRGLRYK